MTKKREYPTLALETNKILKVVEIISKFGGSATRSQVEEDTGIKVGMGAIIASAKQYSLIQREEGSANLSLTDLGKAYCLASDEEGKKLVIIRVILNVPYYKKLVQEKEFYKNPSLSVLKQIMKKYGIPDKDAGAVAGVFRRNLSIWSLSFNDLKTTEQTFNEYGETEVLNIKTIQNIKPIPIELNNLISGVKLSWLISYLKYSHKELDKQALLNILDNMLSQSNSFKELTKEIESAKKFSQYADEKGITAYIRDHFESALAKDIGVEKISDLIDRKEVKSKQKKESIPESNYPTEDDKPQ
jgi:hypothetical protein